MYDDQGRFLGHSIEVEHHTMGNRAWSLGGTGVNEWCYPDSPCDSCQRARMGDPWEIIQRVRALHEFDGVHSCLGCRDNAPWPCDTIRAIEGEL